MMIVLLEVILILLDVLGTLSVVVFDGTILIIGLLVGVLLLVAVVGDVFAGIVAGIGIIFLTITGLGLAIGAGVEQFFTVSPL